MIDPVTVKLGKLLFRQCFFIALIYPVFWSSSDNVLIRVQRNIVILPVFLLTYIKYYLLIMKDLCYIPPAFTTYKRESITSITVVTDDKK